MSAPFRLARTLIRVSGPDATGFLGNLLTQSVERLDEVGVAYGALLTPQGKLVTDMLLWTGGDGIIIDVDRSRSADLLQRLSMYRLRAQVALEEVTGQFDVLWSANPFRGGQADPRFPDGALGWREICPLPAKWNGFENGAAPFDVHRIALGVPDLARDAAPEEVFALEALLEELHGVDLQKGCFVGQENVSRMKRRATTRKKFCPIVFEGAPPAYGSKILAAEAELGTVRSGIEGRAIALLRLDRALAATDGGVALTAEGKQVGLDPPPWLILPARDA